MSERLFFLDFAQYAQIGSVRWKGDYLGLSSAKSIYVS